MRDYWDNIRLFNRNVRWFLAATAIHGFVFFGIYSLLLNLYLIRLGYESEFIGVVNGIGPLMLALFSLPAGVVSRRYGGRRVMMGGYVVTAVSLGLLPLAALVPAAVREPWIAGIYAVTWAAGAFVIVNFSPYLMRWTGESERNYAFAIQSALFPVAGFVGSFFGGVLPVLFASLTGLTLESPVPYRYALLVAAAIDLLAAFAIWKTDEVGGSVAAAQKGEQQDDGPLPIRMITLFTIVSLLMIAGEWTMRVYFNVYLDTTLGAHTTLIGTLSAGALFMGLLALMSPRAAARWGRQKVVLIGLLGVFVAFLPWILVEHWLAAGVGYMIMIGSVSLTNPTFLVFSQTVVKPRWHTTIASAIAMSVGLGVAITSFGGGLIIATFGFQTLFLLGAACGLLGAFVVWRFLPREEPELITVPQASD